MKKETGTKQKELRCRVEFCSLVKMRFLFPTGTREGSVCWISKKPDLNQVFHRSADSARTPTAELNPIVVVDPSTIFRRNHLCGESTWRGSGSEPTGTRRW